MMLTSILIPFPPKYYKEVRILDSESNYNKKLILEMLHIKEQFNSINSQKNTEFLDDSYFCSLDNLSNYY